MSRAGSAPQPAAVVASAVAVSSAEFWSRYRASGERGGGRSRGGVGGVGVPSGGASLGLVRKRGCNRGSRWGAMDGAARKSRSSSSSLSAGDGVVIVVAA
eukprot:5008339-Lingulodinium_polyedra.AAC.1